MEFHAPDVIYGSLLVLGLLLAMIGLGIWRYRGRAGPLVLALSGALMTFISLLKLIAYLFNGSLGTTPMMAGYTLCAILFILASVLWRKGE